jgi:hypothetical protein
MEEAIRGQGYLEEAVEAARDIWRRLLKRPGLFGGGC